MHYNLARKNDEQRALEMFRRLEQTSPSIREVFARIIVGLAERIRQEQKHRGDVVGLGADQLSNLMDTDRQRRYAELDPWLSRAFRAFALLNEMGRTIILFKLYEPIALVDLYCEVCKRSRSVPSTADIRRIIQTSMVDGSQDGYRLLETLLGPEALLFDAESQAQTHAPQTAGT
jgi:hypothetical protein